MELGNPTVWLKDRSVVLTYESYDEALDAFEVLRLEVKAGQLVSMMDARTREEYYRDRPSGEV